MAPIINIATLGAVKVGDSDLLVEMNVTDMPSLLLATNIVCCDFVDAGYTILPVKVEHPYETGFGKNITAPYFFQTCASAETEAVNRLLGANLSAGEIRNALEKMGIEAEITGDAVRITPPPYRNDFLHAVDIIEDVMIGCGISAFPPENPKDFTIGRLSPLTLFSRKAKSLMVGLGYQEMIFNYLGSKRDFIEKMNLSGSVQEKQIIEISNPMTENYQFVRASVLPSLLSAEAPSGNAVYPHKIFEIGKTLIRCDTEDTGTKTRQILGLLFADAEANFNAIASQISSLLYYLGCGYTVRESSDPRFIPGRQAELTVNGKAIGIFGEIHPGVLENWSISVPCAAAEIDLETLMELGYC